MRYIKIPFLTAIFLLLVLNLRAQDVAPVRVEGPIVSRTVFHDWDQIEIVFSVGYLDGYELIFDDLTPDRMNFSPLEPDPIKGNKLSRRNERKFNNENYVDLVYYVRYIGEKKDEFIIQSQIFSYRRLGGGEGISVPVVQVKSEPFRVRYDSVLTKGASDIMDPIDLGSFQNKSLLWRAGSVAWLIFSSLGVLIFVFRKPVLEVALINAGSPASPVISKPIDVELLIFNLSKECDALSLAYTGQVLISHSRAICDLGSDLLRRYVPNSTTAHTLDDLRPMIKEILEPRLQGDLSELLSLIKDFEKRLYNVGDDNLELISTAIKADVVHLRLDILPQLSPRRVSRHALWFKVRRKLSPSNWIKSWRS